MPSLDFNPNGNRNWSRAPLLALLALAGLSLACSRARSNPPTQETFPTASAAAAALFTAVQGNDQAALLRIFGPTAKPILSSGNTAEDQANRQRFIAGYQRMHRLQGEPDGAVLLFVGAENWPFPVPLVGDNGRWSFDTPAGEKTILYRRIGRNELVAIRVCHELVGAQRQYFALQGRQYAQHFVSDNGSHNGLFWPGGPNTRGAEVSPIGPRLAVASADRQPLPANARPFHGYYFRILAAQGSGAPGGAKNYIRDGRMSGGFAFLAYPAEYRSSGVMTFIVNSDGIVYQQDLGPQTATLALQIAAYDPGPGWQPAESPAAPLSAAR